MNVVPYMNLKDDSLKKIVKMKFNFIEKQLNNKEIKFTYEEAILDRIVFLSNAMDTGARNIDLIINTNIMPKLSKIILDATVEQNRLLAVKICLDSNDKIEIKSKFEAKNKLASKNK
jgi:type VI secretion system protein VasG